MPKALIVNNKGYGNTYPTLGLITELIRKGEEVIYFSPDKRVKGDVERAGATFEYCDLEELEQVQPEEVSVGFEFVIKKAQSRLLFNEKLKPKVLQQIQKHQANYVIHNAYSLWGRTAADDAGIPAVCFYPVFPYNDEMILNHPDFIKSAIGAKQSVEEIASLVGHVIQILQARFNVSSFTKALFSNGGLNLVFASRYFQPYAETFDPTFHFVGRPMVQFDNEPLDSYQEKSGHGIIYVTLGTTYNHNTTFFRNVITALADMDKHIVMCVGPEFDVDALGTIPPNFSIRQLVPQLEVIRQAQIVITTGGMGTVSDAMLEGVPVIVVPQAGDQFLVASRIEALGAGVQINIHELTVEKIRMSVDQVQNHYDYYQTNSRKIGQSLLETGGAEHAAELVIRFGTGQAIESQYIKHGKE